MCTVTYLPLSSDSFILTSNRDESKLRPTLPPVVEQRAAVKLLYPKDSLAGGTWICLSSQNRLACIMNGAFERHEKKPPYRRSRGLVLLDLFDFESAALFLKEYDFTHIEPFTIIIYDRLSFNEMRWDGIQKHIRPLDISKPQIWSSASLYPKPVRNKRESWFVQWLEGRDVFKQEDILKFHRFGGEGDKENDFVMNRFDMVQTVSITSILKKPASATMRYDDLVTGTVTESTLELNP